MRAPPRSRRSPTSSRCATAWSSGLDRRDRRVPAAPTRSTTAARSRSRRPTCPGSRSRGSSTRPLADVERSLPDRGRRHVRHPRHRRRRRAGAGSSAASAPTRSRVVARTADWTVARRGTAAARDDLGAVYRIVSADAPALGGDPGDEPPRHPGPLPGRRPCGVDGPDDEVIVVDGPPGAHRDRGPQRRRRPGPPRRARVRRRRRRGAPGRARPDPRRVRATRRLTAVFGSYDDAPSVPTHGLDLPQPAAPPRAPDQPRTGDVVLDRARGRAPRRVRGGRRVRRASATAYPSIEDIDLGQRLVERGAAIRLDPTIQGTHLKAWTLRSMLWTDFARRGVPWVALMWRSRSVPRIAQPRAGVTGSARPRAGHRGRRRARFARAGRRAASALLVALNRSFYALLVRRQGVARAVVGVGLHALHHLVAVGRRARSGVVQRGRRRSAAAASTGDGAPERRARRRARE